MPPATSLDLVAENAELRAKLAEAEDMLRAIRRGEIDALVMQSHTDPRVYTLQSVDSASNLGEMLAIISDAVIAVDGDRRVTYVNPAARQLFSLDASAALGKPASEIPELRLLNGLINENSISNGAWHGEAVDRGRNSQRRHLEATLMARRNDCEGAAGILATFRDISDRKRAEEELRENEEFNRSLMDGSPDCVKVLDVDGRVLRMNGPGLCLMEIGDFGPLCGQEWSALWPPAARQDIERAVAAALGGDTYAFPAFCPTAKGTPRWWEVVVSPIRTTADGPVVRLLAVSRDISDRKRAEEELRRSEQLHRIAFDLAPAGIVYVTLHGHFMQMNARMCEITGYAADELLRMNAGDLTHPDDLAHDKQLIHAFLSGATPSYEIEKRYVRKDGSSRWVAVAGRMVTDDAGRPLHSVCTVRDIQERKTAVAALHTSETRYRRLFEAAHDGLLIIDPATRKIVDANPFMTTLLGYPHDQLIGMELYQIGFLADAQASRDMFQTLTTTRQVRYETLPLQTQKGGFRDVEVVANLYDEDGQSVVQCNVRDITERKAAEAALAKSEERQAFLLRLSDELRAEPSADAIANRALRMLFEHMRLDRCYIGIYRLAEDRGDFPYQVHDDRLPPLPAHVPLSDFPKSLQIVINRTLVIDDVMEMEGLSSRDQSSIIGLGARALINATLRKGKNQPLWALIAASTAARIWTQSEVSLVEETAERIWAAVERARAEAALAKSDNRFRMAISNSPITVFEQDLDLRYTWLYNAKLGFDETSPLGRTNAELLGPANADRVDAVKRRALETGQHSHQEVTVERPGHGLNHFELSVEPRRGPDGQINGVIGTSIDITERKQMEAALQASEHRYRTLIEATSAVSWSCAPSGLQVEPQPQWMAFTGQSAAEMLGTGYATAFHPDDAEDAAARWVDAVSRAEPYLSEHRIRRHDGEWRWMRVSSVPVYQDGGVAEWFGMGVDITERKRAEFALRESEARQHNVLKASRIGTFDVDLGSGKSLWNPTLFGLLGLRPGEAPPGTATFFRHVHPEDLHGLQAIWEAAIESGTLNAEFRIIRADGQIRWLAARGDISDRTGDDPRRARRYLGVNFDITERKEQEKHLRFLMKEVNHRSKNMLGLVQAVAQQTAKTSPDDFIAHFGERIQALAAAQDLLVKSEWKAVSLSELIHSQLAHFQDLIGDRIQLHGPVVEVLPAAAQSIGMAVHELATNAGKYGALSNQIGRIEVTWDTLAGQCGEPQFLMSWTETDGPPVTRPTRRGFGSTVIGGMINMSLDCEAEIDYAPTGLRWRIACPADNIVEKVAAAKARPAPPVVQSAATGSKRVLVVEDEALIAMEIAAILSDAGFTVVGPVGSVEQTLALIERSGCEAAVLDINLGKETAEPIARVLSARATPFVTISGYSREQQPAAFRNAPLVGKPVRPELLVAEIRKCLNDVY